MVERPSELDELPAFLAHAIAAHAREWQRNGLRVPPVALALAGWCTEVAQNGTGAQKVSQSEPVGHGVHMAPLLLTVPEAAALLAVSVRTVRNMLADGRLEKVKIAGATRIRRGDVEAVALLGRPMSPRFRDQIEAKDGLGGNAA